MEKRLKTSIARSVNLNISENRVHGSYKKAKQSIWLQELLSEVVGRPCEKVTIRIDNLYAIALTKNPIFHERSTYIHIRYHFMRECVEDEQVEVEHVPGNKQKPDIITKALGRIKFREMRSFIGVQDVGENKFKIKGENVVVSLKYLEA